jgi:hypothetical protein
MVNSPWLGCLRVSQVISPARTADALRLRYILCISCGSFGNSRCDYTINKGRDMDAAFLVYYLTRKPSAVVTGTSRFCGRFVGDIIKLTLRPPSVRQRSGCVAQAPGSGFS